MKRVLVFMVLFIPVILFSQKVIFLHHSTGRGVWNGGVVQWIQNYNSINSTNYDVTEQEYPNTPYPWKNYPYDYWNLWINNQCNSGNSNIECMNTLAEKYDLIIYKHCFPGAAIQADKGTPNVASENKSLENYKVQYRALRAMMDSYPNTKFMIWTLAPLHRLSTTAEDAARAKQFVDWVKTEWLTEDGNPHPNIYIFDFFNLAAETSQSPANGQVNCLKYEYELNHSSGDSHPNTTANQAIAPKFAEAIVQALAKPVYVSVRTIPAQSAFHKISSSKVIDFTTSVDLNLYSLTGQKILAKTDITQLSVKHLAQGIYLMCYSDKEHNTFSGKLLIE